MASKNISDRIKITEDRQGNVIITIEAQKTPTSLADVNGNVVIKDRFGNEISMSKSGIRISSASDLRLEAAKKIYINGKRGISEVVERGAIEISADKITINAKNEINVKAANNIVLKGSKIKGN